MKLYAKIVGSGPPLIILHGLFGMSDNWLTIAKTLAKEGYTVHIPDLRNHGRSPHAETHRYPDMCDDLLLYLEENHIETAPIMGHSMGGKLAMIFALLHPEKLNKLIVVDIAPSSYHQPENNFHANLIESLLDIDLSAYQERGAIRQELEARLHDRPLALFLAKNIDKVGASKSFRWRLNLPVLQKFISHLHIGLEELEIYAPCPVKTLFIKGNDSNYYLPEHEPDRAFFFPDSEVTGIDNAGHWVHSDQAVVLSKLVAQFLQRT